jgi:CRP-like cAMP-binding protein
MTTRTRPTATRTRPTTAASIKAFDLQVFLDSAGIDRTVKKYDKSAVVFSQGDPATDVFYLQQGSVKLSVLSRIGKEAVVGILGPGDFFGEGSLAGQPLRMATAATLVASTALVLERSHMVEMLQKESTLAERFLSHMLARNIKIEEDLIDQLFNSSEKRLARALLLLARYGKEDQPLRLPKISQQTLAEMVGTTRSRVNFFMNKFRDLGFIEYNGDIKVNRTTRAGSSKRRASRGSVLQHDAQHGTVDEETAVSRAAALEKPELPKLVHEIVHPGPGGSDQVGQKVPGDVRQRVAR